MRIKVHPGSYCIVIITCILNSCDDCTVSEKVDLDLRKEERLSAGRQSNPIVSGLLIDPLCLT